MPAPTVVVTTDGESRPVTRTWDDGAWECPFCRCPNLPDEENPWPYPCCNPACIAGGRGDLASVRAVRAQWAAQGEATAARKRLEARSEEDRKQREHAAQAAQEAFRREAEQLGYCTACWSRSTDYGRFLSHPVKIRHRKPENCQYARGRR